MLNLTKEMESDDIRCLHFCDRGAHTSNPQPTTPAWIRIAIVLSPSSQQWVLIKVIVQSAYALNCTKMQTVCQNRPPELKLLKRTFYSAPGELIRLKRINPLLAVQSAHLLRDLQTNYS